MIKFKSLGAAALVTIALTSTGMASSKTPTARDRAEAACYNDVMALCNDVVPDEVKIEACMQEKHAQLSHGCAKIFDKGMKKK